PARRPTRGPGGRPGRRARAARLGVARGAGERGDVRGRPRCDRRARDLGRACGRDGALTPFAVLALPAVVVYDAPMTDEERLRRRLIAAGPLVAAMDELMRLDLGDAEPFCPARRLPDDAG